MDAWKTSFLLGRPIFRDYVSFKEGIHKQLLNLEPLPANGDSFIKVARERVFLIQGPQQGMCFCYKLISNWNGIVLLQTH